jgi:hypothetical protein
MTGELAPIGSSSRAKRKACLDREMLFSPLCPRHKLVVGDDAEAVFWEGGGGRAGGHL